MEIERKFLVNQALLEVDPSKGMTVLQGYPVENDSHILRVRVEVNPGFKSNERKAWITIKSKDSQLIEGWVARDEIEFEVPAIRVEGMLSGCKNILVKRRYKLEFGGLPWDIDFIQQKDGVLVLAEVEVPPGASIDELELPPWVTEEVTGDPQYYNSNLANGYGGER